jgi:hypothetical protein
MLVPFGMSVGGRLGSSGPVVLDTLSAVNGHGLFVGTSGTGKTHRLRDGVKQLVNSAAKLQRPIRVHVIDVHGDIVIPGASEVLFSESTQWGFNPLEINPDPHFGGVRRAIQQFIAAVKRQKTIGTKQEAVLRYMLEDLYALRGFKADDPSTWIPEDPRVVRQMLAGKEGRLYLDVAWEHLERFKSLIKDSQGRKFGGWDGELKCWWVEKDKYEGDLLMWSPRVLFKSSPTVDDLLGFAESKLKALFMGGNGAAIAHLMDHNRAASLFHRKALDLAKRGEVLSAEDHDAMLKKLGETKGKAIDSYDSFLESVTTGRELDEVLRYNSVDVLTSVYERLQNLRAVGIFRSGVPPFDPRMPVWRYVVKPLDVPEQRMFVAVVLRRIFERAVQRGEQNDVVELILIDEASRFAYGDEDNILSVIANEARKFGLALWCAAQSPEQFSDDFLKNVAFKVVLGLAPSDVGPAVRKLGIEVAVHDKIVPRSMGLVQIRNAGELQSAFVLTSMQ